MRIAIDVRPLIEPFPSGISEYTLQIAQNLIDTYPDNEYVLYCNAASGTPAAAQQLGEHGSVSIQSSQIPNKFFNTKLAILQRPRLDQLTGSPDIFFMPNINFAAVSQKTPLVVTAHDVSFSHPSFYPLKARLWHRFINPGRLYRRADAIIAVSQSTKRDIIDHFQIPEQRIKVIYHGVDAHKYSNVSSERIADIRQHYGITRPYVLFLGNVEERKNIMGLLNAWDRVYRRNPAYDLAIVGNHGSMKVPAQPGVLQLGYTPEDHKPALYSGATAFVYPSFYEGFGLPLLEAMAAGLPVITSYSTALAEVVGEAAIMIDPYNTRELGRAITQVLEEESLRTLLSKRGTRRAKEFSWQRTAQETFEVFNSLTR